MGIRWPHGYQRRFKFLTVMVAQGHSLSQALHQPPLRIRRADANLGIDIGVAAQNIGHQTLSGAGPASNQRALAAALPNQYGAVALEMARSEEHTSELQSRVSFVCRLSL